MIRGTNGSVGGDLHISTLVNDEFTSGDSFHSDEETDEQPKHRYQPQSGGLDDSSGEDATEPQSPVHQIPAFMGAIAAAAAPGPPTNGHVSDRNATSDSGKEVPMDTNDEYLLAKRQREELRSKERLKKRKLSEKKKSPSTTDKEEDVAPKTNQQQSASLIRNTDGAGPSKVVVIGNEPEKAAAAAAAPLPTRASAGRTSGLNVSMFENLTIKFSAMDDEACAAWLAKMAPEMASKVLQELGAEYPMRAITLQKLVETAQNAASKVTEVEEKAAPIATRKSPRNISKKFTVFDEWESDGTISEEEKRSSRRRRRGRGSLPTGKYTAGNHAAICSRGHTNLGRVKHGSYKKVDLVEVGALQTENGWHNAGYIFPEGFQSRTTFRSSVSIDQHCVHECFIIGEGGEHWPLPTFKVVALDRPDEPIIARSCTGCWTGIQKRINSEIESSRRNAGEELLPPPKTVIAGPEYFGLNRPDITDEIEALDPEHKCVYYWSGKEERMRAAAGLPSINASGSGGGARGAPRGRGRRRRRNRNGSDSEGEDGEGDEAQLMSKWNTVSREERYRRRLNLKDDNDEDTNINQVGAPDALITPGPTAPPPAPRSAAKSTVPPNRPEIALTARKSVNPRKLPVRSPVPVEEAVAAATAAAGAAAAAEAAAAAAGPNPSPLPAARSTVPPNRQKDARIIRKSVIPRNLPVRSPSVEEEAAMAVEAAAAGPNPAPLAAAQHAPPSQPQPVTTVSPSPALPPAPTSTPNTAGDLAGIVIECVLPLSSILPRGTVCGYLTKFPKMSRGEQEQHAVFVTALAQGGPACYAELQDFVQRNSQ